MFIINTVHRRKFRQAGFFTAYCIFISVILIGCAKNSQLDNARNSTVQSQRYYERAITQYKDLIAKGKDSERANYELGLLYYQHGEYESARQYLSNSKLPESKKYAAMSLYKLGDFTEALNAFRQIKNSDLESLYYYGLSCEKLNLFDEALKTYRSIKEEPFETQSLDRIKIITQENTNLTVSNLAQDIQNIIRNAPPSEKYPNAGALILYVDEKFEVTPQNTAVLYQHFLVKILNERGKEDFSEIVVDYDSTYEKVELEYARTIRPDGAVVPVGTRHIRDVSKYLNFPLYSNAKAMIISFPESMQGAILEYRIKLYRNELINKKDFILPYAVQETEPVIFARLVLDVPADKRINYKILNLQYNDYEANLTPSINKKNQRTEYLWEFKDIPQIIPESNMPPLVEISPIILISTFDSWQGIYDWWWNLTKDKIKADRAIKDKVAELTAGKNTLADKIKAIYNFCARDIRYVAVEYGQAGYEPHQASDIFSNKYGDCKDQAILLVTMLREIGAQAYPVLISTKEAINLQEDSPAVDFNHCIAMVKMEDGSVFLDPTASTCSFGDLPADDQERRVLVFQDDSYKIEPTPLYSPQHNRLLQKLKVKVAPDEGIAAQRGVFTYGQYDQMQRAWIMYTPPELISQALEEKIQNICIGGQLTRYSVRNVEDLNTPSTLEYSFSGQEYWTKAGALRIMPQLADFDTSVVAKKERRYPINLGIPEIRIIEFEIEIPAKFKIKYLPANITKESPWIKASVQYTQKNNTIYFRQEIQTKKNAVYPKEYKEFKSFMEDFSRQIQQRAILEKT